MAVLTAIALATPAVSGWGFADEPMTPQPAVDLPAADPDDDAGGEDDKGADRGGPPPWAKAGGHQAKGKTGLEKWKQLSAVEKKNLMTKLSSEHEAGMKAFAACRADGRDDCVKPLPPGHAKRQ